MNKDLPVFKITIDDNDDLGIAQIAYTANPAIEIMGMAFSSIKKKLMFSDDTKQRIAGPIVVPKQIYRMDDDGYEFLVEFEPEQIEKMYHRMMQNLDNKTMFNLEHNVQDQIDSYILETIFVDSEHKQEYIKKQYGLDIPMYSIFIDSQVKDKETYKKLIENNQIGFSIEGLLGLKLSSIVKKQKMNMNKKKFKLAGKSRFNASKFESDEVLTVITEDNTITPDTQAIVIDENLEVIPDYTGDVVIEDQKVHIEDGLITEVVPVTDESTELESDEDEKEKDTELESDEDKETELESEVSTDPILAFEERLTNLESELIERLGKLEAEIEKKNTEESDVNETEVKMSLVDRLKFGSQFTNVK